MISSQPPSAPIIIEEKKVTVDELAGMVARGFKESEKNMKEFIHGFVREEISGFENRIGARIGNLENKVNNLDNRVDSLETKVDSLETKMDAGFESLHKRLDLIFPVHA